jgi:hypothetical protein
MRIKIFQEVSFCKTSSENDKKKFYSEKAPNIDNLLFNVGKHHFKTVEIEVY